MTEGDCLDCGHLHRGGRCRKWVFTDTFGGDCGCRTWKTAVLPARGQRLEFGVHRQRVADAETAPAWGTVGQLRRQLEQRADRAADAALERRRR